MCLILFIPILMNDSKRFTNIIKTAFSVIRSKDFITSFAHLSWMPSSYSTMNSTLLSRLVFAIECKTLFQLLNKYFSKLFECYRSQFIQLGLLLPNDDGFFSSAKCNDFFQLPTINTLANQLPITECQFFSEDMAFYSDFSIGCSHQRQNTVFLMSVAITYFHINVQNFTFESMPSIAIESISQPKSILMSRSIAASTNKREES